MYPVHAYALHVQYFTRVAYILNRSHDYSLSLGDASSFAVRGSGCRVDCWRDVMRVACRFARNLLTLDSMNPGEPPPQTPTPERGRKEHSTSDRGWEDKRREKKGDRSEESPVRLGGDS